MGAGAEEPAPEATEGSKINKHIRHTVNKYIDTVTQY